MALHNLKLVHFAMDCLSQLDERDVRIKELEQRLLTLRQAMPRYGWENLIEDHPEAEHWFNESGTQCT